MSNNEQFTKKQHYVPQFYMKSWCDEDGKMAYLNVEKGQCSHIAPKSCCYIENGYEYGKIKDNWVLPNDMEKKYGDLEDKVGKLLKRAFSMLKDNANHDALIFNKDEKRLLKEFAVTMIIRNPTLDTNGTEIKICENELRHIEATLDELSFEYDPELLQNIVKQLIRNHDFPNDNDLQIGGSMYRAFMEPIETAKLYVMKSNNKFVFSSNPGVFWGNKEYTSLYLPISPMYALYFTTKNVVLRPNKINVIPDENAYMLNKFYKLNGAEYIYASDSSLFQFI